MSPEPSLLLLSARWCGDRWRVNISATISPYANLAVVIRALMVAVADWGGRRFLSGPLTVLIWGRLSRICLRMERLAARFEAGQVCRPGPRLVARASVVSKAFAVRPPRLWPTCFGWAVRLMAWQAAGYGSQLRAVLGEPQMVALLIAAPQAARILRPVCRMLGIETSVLRPRAAGAVVEVAVAPADVACVRKRVRKRREPIDWGRIPLPRGVLAAARRRGFKPCP